MTDRFSPDLDTRASRRHTRASPCTAPLRGQRFRGSCLVRGGGEPPYTLTFGTETREDTVQFRRRTSVLGQYWLVCDQSSTSSENGLDPCRGAIGESPTSSHRKFIVSGQGGGFAVPPPAGGGLAPSPVPTPGVIATTVHSMGEAGEESGSGINLIDTLHHRIRSCQWGLPAPRCPGGDSHHGPLHGEIRGNPTHRGGDEHLNPNRGPTESDNSESVY